MLRLKHKTKEEIPQEYVGLYTEKDGEWHFTGVDGIKTQADIDRLQTAIQKEREEHKGTKEKLKGWEGLDRTEVDARLARLAELEVALEGSVPKAEMEKKLDQMAELRVKNRLMPVEREREQLKTQLAEAEKALATLTAERNQRIVHDKVREAAIAAKVLPDVLPDVLLLADNVFALGENNELLTKENPYGVDPGLTPESFFTTQQEKRGYWWPPSQGGGSKGTVKTPMGGVNNPWSPDSWNLTEQGRVVKEHGMEKAQQLAKMAGTTVGGPKPTSKK